MNSDFQPVEDSLHEIDQVDTKYLFNYFDDYFELEEKRRKLTIWAKEGVWAKDIADF